MQLHISLLARFVRFKLGIITYFLQLPYSFFKKFMKPNSTKRTRNRCLSSHFLDQNHYLYCFDVKFYQKCFFGDKLARWKYKMTYLKIQFIKSGNTIRKVTTNIRAFFIMTILIYLFISFIYFSHFYTKTQGTKRVSLNEIWMIEVIIRTM